MKTVICAFLCFASVVLAQDAKVIRIDPADARTGKSLYEKMKRSEQEYSEWKSEQFRKAGSGYLDINFSADFLNAVMTPLLDWKSITLTPNRTVVTPASGTTAEIR